MEGGHVAVAKRHTTHKRNLTVVNSIQLACLLGLTITQLFFYQVSDLNTLQSGYFVLVGTIAIVAYANYKKHSYWGLLLYRGLTLLCIILSFSTWVSVMIDMVACNRFTDLRLAEAIACYAANPGTAVVDCADPAQGGPVESPGASTVCPTVMFGKGWGNIWMVANFFTVLLILGTAVAGFVITKRAEKIMARLDLGYSHIEKEERILLQKDGLLSAKELREMDRDEQETTRMLDDSAVDRARARFR